MQKDLPFKLTNWISDHAIVFYEIIKNIYIKLARPYHGKEIGPLKYGRNRQALDKTSKRIMREKLKNLK